jgi:hypothetical protein
MPGDRGGRLPVSALLSQVLVAFTIECDNEFERQMLHRTSNYGNTAVRAPVPGWYRWRCGGPACGSSARTGSPSPNSPGAPVPARTCPGCGAGGYISVEPDPATLPRYPMVSTAASSPTAAG